MTSEVRVKPLTLFVTNPDTEYYLKGLVRELGVSNNAVRQELDRLERLRVLSSRRQANIRYYRLNRACPIYPELRGLVLKTTGVARVLRECLQDIGTIELAFIYGSYAQGTEGPASDIDLLVVGHVELGKLRRVLREVERQLGREINETVYDPDEFAELRSRQDGFVQRILAQPRILLMGADDGAH